MTQQRPNYKRLIEAITERQETPQQWEVFIAGILEKLELSPTELQRATACYERLAEHLAQKLEVERTDVHVVVQGSMRTQTTIAQRGNQNFDLDIVVKLSGPRFDGAKFSEPFFQDFGGALQGIPDAGDPQAKRRCWRLPYPGEPFYFDVTPAIPDSRLFVQAGTRNALGTDLRVRDPETEWCPSNPEEFAGWFCNIANKRFPFQTDTYRRLVEARADVDPMPTGRVGLQDILRRALQLIKLHRDGYYWEESARRKEAKPISIILVTLAAQAYDHLVTHRATEFNSPIEVVLELVDQMPSLIEDNGSGFSRGQYRVSNPKLEWENFADRWNRDDGLRAQEFERWHERLGGDLEAMFSEDFSRRSESRIKAVFGQSGVKAWQDSIKPRQGVLKSLLGTLPAGSNPPMPTKAGSGTTLA